jgi:hypothetical protein
MDVHIPVDIIKASPERLKQFLASDRYTKADPVTKHWYEVQLGIYQKNTLN